MLKSGMVTNDPAARVCYCRQVGFDAVQEASSTILAAAELGYPSGPELRTHRRRFDDVGIAVVALAPVRESCGWAMPETEDGRRDSARSPAPCSLLPTLLRERVRTARVASTLVPDGSPTGAGVPASPSNAAGLVLQARTDAQLLELWLFGRSPHTRCAYRREAGRFLAHGAKPLQQVTLGDVQAFATALADPAAPLGPASQARDLAAVKSTDPPATSACSDQVAPLRSAAYSRRSVGFDESVPSLRPAAGRPGYSLTAARPGVPSGPQARTRAMPPQNVARGPTTAAREAKTVLRQVDVNEARDANPQGTSCRLLVNVPTMLPISFR